MRALRLNIRIPALLCVFYASSIVIIFLGQASTHLPQAVHLFGSTVALKFVTVTASSSQTLTHFIQPIQPILQIFITPAPLSQLEHLTTACFLRGTKLISFLGQASTHFEQPLHFSGSIIATPLQMVIAP